MFVVKPWRTLLKYRQPLWGPSKRVMHINQFQCPPEPMEPPEPPMCGDSDDPDKPSDDEPEPPKMTRPERLELPGAVRLGFLPEEWFQFFYKRTGVTGPYMFGIGLLTFLMSKEYYVMEHEYYNGLSMAIISIMATKKLGPYVAKWCDQGVDRVDAEFKQHYKDEIDSLYKAIERERLEQWHAEGALQLVEAKRDNVSLQIEAAFRQELHKVYLDVINKLEYHVECHFVEQRILKKQMALWVAEHVIKSLPPMSPEENEKTRHDMSALAMQLR